MVRLLHELVSMKHEFARDPDDFWLGVNYWPRRKGMYWWKDFDADEVDDEFAQIAEWGMRIVRFFLLWEDFQPNANSVDDLRLENLVTVLNTAQRHGLKATPTLLVGNMSGVMWFPSWAFTGHPERGTAIQISQGEIVHNELRPLFKSPAMLRSEVIFAQHAAQAIAGHPALHSWDLANEIDQARIPESAASGWLWCWIVSEAIRSADARVPITYGAHSLSLTTRGLTIPAISESLNYLAMHGYPIYSKVSRGPLDPEFVPFVTWLTSKLGGKSSVMQEFGVPTSGPGQASHWIEDDFLGELKPQFIASEEDAAHYYQSVLDRLWQTDALGAIAWCYADYAPELWNKPPFNKAVRERTFGIFHSNQTPKPAAEVIRRFSDELSSGAIVRRLGPRGSHAILVDIDPQRYYRDPAQSFAQAYTAYLTERGLEQ